MYNEERIGEHVIYYDEYNRPHAAVITAVWDSESAPDTHHWPDCPVNLVFVSADDQKRDQYGRQIERSTSVVARSHQGAPGRYWCLPDAV